MKIFDLQCHEGRNYREFSGKIDKFRLWFRYPHQFQTDVRDASSLVTAALLPSMLLGEDVVLDEHYYMSARLHVQLDKVQEIFHHWNPVFKRIKVRANTKASSNGGAGNGSFFSGGVDGTYTLCKYQEEIDYLILINGFDFNMDNETWQQMVHRNGEFATRFNKQLVSIETNYKAFTNSCGLRRYANYGTCLAAISQMLGLNKVFFSGSATYEHLYEDGVHALLDPLWSTEITEVVHTGLNADRSRKLALIKQYPEAIANLWVCWWDPRWNCGTCSKCIRTYVALRLNDVSGCKFKHPVTINDVKRLSIGDEHDCGYFSHFFDQAVKQGDKELAKVLGRMIGKYKIKMFLLSMDRYFLSGQAKKLQLKLFPPEQKFVPIDITPQTTDKHMARIAISRIRDQALPQESVSIGSVYDLDQVPSEAEDGKL